MCLSYHCKTNRARENFTLNGRLKKYKANIGLFKVLIHVGVRCANIRKVCVGVLFKILKILTHKLTDYVILAN